MTKNPQSTFTIPKLQGRGVVGESSIANIDQTKSEGFVKFDEVLRHFLHHLVHLLAPVEDGGWGMTTMMLLMITSSEASWA